MGVDGERADKAGWLYVVAGRGGQEGRPAQDEGSLR